MGNTEEIREGEVENEGKNVEEEEGKEIAEYKKQYEFCYTSHVPSL